MMVVAHASPHTCLVFWTRDQSCDVFIEGCHVHSEDCIQMIFFPEFAAFVVQIFLAMQLAESHPTCIK